MGNCLPCGKTRQLRRELQECTKENTPYLTLTGNVLCKVVDVYDGDTVTVAFRLESTSYKLKVRLFGIDAPEIRTQDAVEKRDALISRDVLRNKVLNKLVWLECKGKEKYGRLLGVLYDENKKENINEYMVIKHHAVPYDGKGPRGRNRQRE